MVCMYKTWCEILGLGGVQLKPVVKELADLAQEHLHEGKSQLGAFTVSLVDREQKSAVNDYALNIV